MLFSFPRSRCFLDPLIFAEREDASPDEVVGPFHGTVMASRPIHRDVFRNTPVEFRNTYRTRLLPVVGLAVACSFACTVLGDGAIRSGNGKKKEPRSRQGRNSFPMPPGPRR